MYSVMKPNGKRIVMNHWLLIPAVCGITLNAAVDFTGPGFPPLSLNRAEERGQGASSGKGGLLVKWDAARHPYWEWSFTPPLTLPEFDSAEFRVGLRVTEPDAVRRFNLRLADATGEVFQYEQMPLWPAGGVFTLDYRIDAAKGADRHWGGNGDGKLDFPVRLFGISADCAEGSGKGELAIRSIDWTTRRAGEAATVPVRQTVTMADFRDGFPDIVLNKAEERGQKLTHAVERGALQVEWRRANAGYWEWSYRKPLPLPEFTSARIEVKLTAGSPEPPEWFNLRLADATGEVFQYAKRTDWDRDGVCNLVFELERSQKPVLSWGGNGDGRLDFPVKFLGASGDFKAGEGDGKLWIDSIRGEFVSSVPLSRAVAVTLKGTDPFHLIPPERQGPVLSFHNRSVSAVRLNAELTLRDFDGMAVRKRFPQVLAAGETRPFVWPEKLGRRGIRYLECRFSDPENPGDLSVWNSSFAVMEPAGPTAGAGRGFIFGVCSHPNWTRDREVHRREAEAAALAGAGVVRIDFEWWQIEPEKGKRDYTLYDELVETFAQRGVEFEAILGKPPKWAVVKGNLPDYGAWRSFVREAFRRYRGKIRLWEVWNEPELAGFASFNVPEYVELMRIVREEADREIPGATVLSGGFATMAAHGSKKREDFQEETLKRGRGLFDLHAYHEHGTFPQYRQLVDGLFLPMRKRAGVAVPWYANETAITSAGVGEREQAVTLAKKLVFAWSRGAVGYNWYNLRNKGDDPRDGEHNYGMMTSDFRPKAVYVAFNTLAGLLRDHGFVRQIPVADGGMLFEFRNGTERVLCGWNEEFRSAGKRLLVDSDAVRAELIDLMGNVVPAERLGDRLLLPLERTPAFLRLAGADRVEVAGGVMRIIPPPVAVPGRTLPLEIELLSPVSSPVNAKLTLLPPAGLRTESESAELTLKPGEKLVWSTQLSVGGDFQPKLGEAETVMVECRIPALGYRDRFEQPVVGALPLPARFDLNRKNQTVSLFDADPTKTALVWSGPGDLSAEVRLDASDRELLLRVDVTDDRHCQPFWGSDMWQGDGVQFALAVPGQQGLWELGLSLSDSGGSECFAWSVPNGFDRTAAAAAMRLEAERRGTVTHYRAAIPLAALGLDRTKLREGIRFNLLVNDNDGEARKGWIAAAPGIGSGKDAGKYPVVVGP